MKMVIDGQPLQARAAFYAIISDFLKSPLYLNISHLYA